MYGAVDEQVCQHAAAKGQPCPWPMRQWLELCCFTSYSFYLMLYPGLPKCTRAHRAPDAMGQGSRRSGPIIGHGDQVEATPDFQCSFAPVLPAVLRTKLVLPAFSGACPGNGRKGQVNLARKSVRPNTEHRADDRRGCRLTMACANQEKVNQPWSSVEMFA